jgi:hypothetical protein
MKKLIVGLLLAAAAGLAWAGDKGAQRVAGTVTDGTGTLTPVPAGGTGRFTPTYVIFAAAATTTQTVSYTVAGQTHTYGAKVLAAADRVLALTNVPPLLAGDTITIASTAATSTNAVYVVGNLFE